LNNDVNLNKLAEKAMKLVVPEDNVSMSDGWGTGCTDMGDLSSVMPSIHPYVMGTSGTAHGNDYKISDVETACIDSAKAQLVLLHILLSNDAAEAKYIIENKNLPYKSYEEYFNAIDKFILDKKAVIYKEDGKVELDIC